MNTTIFRPAAGQHTTLPSGEISQFILTFPASEVTLEREGDTLVFRFADGASISIPDFYTTYYSDTAPDFEVDGQLLSGTAFFQAFAPDLAPAAGPSAETRNAHYTEHGTSELAAGVDHLDGLEMNVPGSSAQYGELALDSPLMAESGSSSGGLTPAPPAPGPDPVPRPEGPFVRAVLYNPGNTNDPVATSVFFAEDGQPPVAIAPGDLDFTGAAPWAQYGIAISLPEGWEESWVDVAFDYSTGKLEFRLTDDGVAEMQRLGVDGEPLVDFIHVTVTDRNTGNEFEYNVEFVATEDPSFDSPAFDSRYEGHENLENIGEFHQGKGEKGAYSIISSDRNDEITLNDTVIGGSSIYASGSADPQQMADDYNTITLNQGVLASQEDLTTHITSSDGKLTVAQGIAATATGGGNEIDMGKGTVSVSNDTKDAAVVLADTGHNSITGHDISITTGQNLVRASNGGSNIIHSTGGDIDLSTVKRGSQAVLADSGGLNHVIAENGNLTVGIDGYAGVRALSGGQNILEGRGNAAVTVSNSGGAGMMASGGSNTITSEEGKITVSAATAAAMSAESNGVNRIEGPDIAVSSTSNALVSTSGGKNYIDAGNDGSVTVQGGTNAIRVDGADSLAQVNGGDISIKSSNSAAYVLKQGTIDITGNTVDLTSANGRTVDNNQGTINIDAEDALNIHLTNASETSSAVRTSGGATTLKSGGDINLTVDRGTYQTSGIVATNNGTNDVEAENTINIKVHAESNGGVSYGASGILTGSASGDLNTITAKHGDINLDVDSSATMAVGVTTSGYGAANTATTNISAKEGTFNVNVAGTGMAYNAIGIYADGSGKNTIDASAMNVAVTLDQGYNSDGTVDAAGIVAQHNGQAGGSNSIDVSGVMNVTVTGGSNTSGILAQGQGATNSTNIINSGTMNIDVTNMGNVAGSRATGVESSYNPDTRSSGGDNFITVDNDAAINVTAQGQATLAAGFYSTDSGKQILTAGGDVDMNVTSTAGKAYGVFGGASITGDSVTMTIKGDLSAIVLDGSATVTGSTVNLNAESANGTAYGMYNTGYGTNTVQSGSGQSLNLEINADYAMHAESGQNVIRGNSVSGGEGDVIHLNGDIYQSGSGSNHIILGDGDGTIIIDGAINGTGALNIEGGTGTDTLILQAADIDEFMDRYSEWLNGLDSTILSGVERIEFAGVDDLNDLRPGLDSFFDYVDGVQPPIEVVIYAPDTDASPFSAFDMDDDGLLFHDGQGHHDQDSGNSHAGNDQEHPARDSMDGGLAADITAQEHTAPGSASVPDLLDGDVRNAPTTEDGRPAINAYAHVGLTTHDDSLDSLLPEATPPAPATPTAESAPVTILAIAQVSTVTSATQEMVDTAARHMDSC